MFLFQINSLFKTLRFRLMLWNISVVLISVVLTLIALRTSFRVTLLRETDQLLREDAIEIELAANAMHPDLNAIRAEIERHTASHKHRGLFVQLYDKNKKPVFSSLDLEGIPLPKNPVRISNTLLTSEGFRFLDKSLQGNVAKDFSGFRVGSRMDLVEEDVESLSWLMVASMGFVVLIAPIGGYILAVQATKPIADIINTTSRLRPQNLTERFIIKGTGDELDRLTLTINSFLDRIADFIQKKREFVANAAHELRSPLTAIGAASELALARERTPEEYRKTLGEISDKCEHFRLLINQLLLLAETEAGANIPHHVIQMDRIIEKSYDMFKDVALQQHIHFKLDSTSPALVLGEARQIQQVVNNLIDNALKFTPEGGTIVVELYKEASKIVLNVSDTGVGISKEDQSKVFDRFFQADRSHTKNAEAFGGNGLGLSICKAIVESMGGNISVTSIPEKGSTFTITLPLIGPV
jgi:signal transduction histidine kinase